MIDYCTTEIVAYADELPSWAKDAPLRINSSYVHSDELPSTTPWYVAVECPVSDLPDYVPQSNIDLGYTFYWLICNVDEEGRYPVDWKVLYFKHNDYFRADIVYTVDGEDVFFLYDFGEFLFNSSYDISNLLNIDIGGYNLLTLFFGSGFVVYALWCITKWFLPL